MLRRPAESNDFAGFFVGMRVACPLLYSPVPGFVAPQGKPGSAPVDTRVSATFNVRAQLVLRCIGRRAAALLRLLNMHSRGIG